MSSDLEALKAALTRQLAAIDEQARAVGCPRELLVDVTGYVAAPVLVALTNVEIALLAQQPASARQCGVSRIGHTGWPCVLPKGHVESHRDEDGDTFYA